MGVMVDQSDKARRVTSSPRVQTDSEDIPFGGARRHRIIKKLSAIGISNSNWRGFPYKHCRLGPILLLVGNRTQKRVRDKRLLSRDAVSLFDLQSSYSRQRRVPRSRRPQSKLKLYVKANDDRTCSYS
jgi:hypothetical protein